MKCYHLLLAGSVFIFSCSSRNNSAVEVRSVVPETTETVNVKDCVDLSDSTLVETFISHTIEAMKAENYDAIASAMYDALDFKDQLLTEPDMVKSMFAAYHYSAPSDSFIPISQESTKVIYVKKEASECYFVQVGLLTGLYFDLDKVDGQLKIVRFDTAG